MTPAHFSFSINRGADFATGWQLTVDSRPFPTNIDTFTATLLNSSGTIVDTPDISQTSDTVTNLLIPASRTATLPLQTLRLLVNWHRHDGAVLSLIIGRISVF